MPATPRKTRPGKTAPAARPAGFWESRVEPMLARGSLPAALLLAAIACARIVSTYPELSITSDEPAHFACGLEYLSQHVYKLEPQHPPLARAMTALGAYMEGLRPVRGIDFTDVAYNVLAGSGNALHYIFLMRLGILPFFLLGCAVVYFWTARTFGKAAALLAVAIFTLQPVVLAHAGLATTDMALASCTGLAFVAIVAWAASPTWPRCLMMSLAASLAVLSKFSALGYVPAAAVFAALIYMVAERPGWTTLRQLALRRLPGLAAAIALTAFTIWAAYWFSFGAVPGWTIRLPAPEFFDGVRFAAHHSSRGHPCYLLGQYGATGWWYFFPVALSVKTPIAALALMLAGLVALRRRRGALPWMPAAFALGILLPAMTSHVNIGTRHVLPVYISFSIWGALGILHLGRAFRGPALAIGAPAVLLVWMAVSGARQHPDYLAYFNEFAGSEPDRVLVDSDLDWGQEVVRLSRRLHELHADHVSVLFLQASRYLDFYRKVYGLPPIQPFNPQIPNAGWNAVSPTVLHQAAAGGRPDQDFEVKTGEFTIRSPWYERLPATARAGALFLYDIPPNYVPR